MIVGSYLEKLSASKNQGCGKGAGVQLAGRCCSESLCPGGRFCCQLEMIFLKFDVVEQRIVLHDARICEHTHTLKV